MFGSLYLGPRFRSRSRSVCGHRRNFDGRCIKPAGFPKLARGYDFDLAEDPAGSALPSDADANDARFIERMAVLAMRSGYSLHE